MGISLTANNSKYDFSMGYGGFRNLRVNIAKAYDPDFGEHYANLIHCYTVKQFEEHDKVANLMISKFPEEDEDIFDFLYQSDCEGRINYRTCGKIYNLIKDKDFTNMIFMYSTLSDGKDYEHLKAFLKECYSHRRNAYWR